MCYNTNECIKQFSVCLNTCLNIAIVKNILSELLTVDYLPIDLRRLRNTLYTYEKPYKKEQYI